MKPKVNTRREYSVIYIEPVVRAYVDSSGVVPGSLYSVRRRFMTVFQTKECKYIPKGKEYGIRKSMGRVYWWIVPNEIAVHFGYKWNSYYHKKEQEQAIRNQITALKNRLI